MKFSQIEQLASFALLGPGFASGDIVLLTNLHAVDRDPTLVYAPFESHGSAAQMYAAETARPIAIEHESVELPLTVTLNDTGYAFHIAAIREAIACGDVYQVCYTRRVTIPSIPAHQLASMLCCQEMPRFFAWVRLPSGEEFISGSPELFFEIEGRAVHAQPMKGTARSGDGSVLELSEKDKAELAMITDLLRNDLTPACNPLTVTVACERRTIELPYAVQTVSDVIGELIGSATPLDVLAALHPGGSVTGAPKRAALEHIRKLEQTPRGAYCGSLGYCRGDRSVFSILIRTATRSQDGWIYGVGSGVVYDSDAESELRELYVKLGALKFADESVQ